MLSLGTCIGDWAARRLAESYHDYLHIRLGRHMDDAHAGQALSMTHEKFIDIRNDVNRPICRGFSPTTLSPVMFM
jgi:hypothetical protein